MRPVRARSWRVCRFRRRRVVGAAAACRARRSRPASVLVDRRTTWTAAAPRNEPTAERSTIRACQAHRILCLATRQRTSSVGRRWGYSADRPTRSRTLRRPGVREIVAAPCTCRAIAAATADSRIRESVRQQGEYRRAKARVPGQLQEQLRASVSSKARFGLAVPAPKDAADGGGRDRRNRGLAAAQLRSRQTFHFRPPLHPKWAAPRSRPPPPAVLHSPSTGSGKPTMR